MRLRLAIFLFLATAGRGFAQTHDITPADYFTLASITDLAVAPDGGQVVYAEARWDKADDSRKTDLWLVATDGNGRRLHLRSRQRPRPWSADWQGARRSTSSAAAAARPEKKPPYDGKMRFWSIRVDGGGDPQSLTRRRRRHRLRLRPGRRPPSGTDRQGRGRRR
ncbi:MAG: hypothetical protein U0793_22060 [Gemmataceae bacterium]